MELERQRPGRADPERDKNRGTRSMGEILAREANSPPEAENSRRRTISFSSEEPYRRYFGMEILAVSYTHLRAHET